ncbi:nucleoside phosphorylase domain-containing protein [Aspergillus karnatakaensis]|uniref:nucleoside phosphorylase domain-containing protein n=1 Tax=Aspergillus karnatakaensis TaxID=1810916 RepID=UPI003CCCF801
MLTQEDYRIGWICALHLELTATEDDENTYVLGGIGQHNIVIACLPAGVYGTTSATAVALQMRASFTAMRFCLMVGIGGGAPTPEADIRLGDVVVSKPTAGYGGVFQYDYGKAVAGGEFLATGSLDKPPAVLLTAISRIQARHHLHGNNIRGIYEEVLGKYKALAGTFVGYDHVEPLETHCRSCDKNMLVVRRSRSHDQPRVFYGLIASANQVLRDSVRRYALSQKHGILCFEMKAAGMMDDIIRRT